MFQSVFELLSSQSFTVLVNVSSVVSLLLTIWVLIGVRSIRRNYTFTARAPELAKELSKRTSKISDYRNDFDHNLLEIDQELVRVRVTLKSLEKKVNRSSKSSITEAINKIGSYNSGVKNKDGLFEVYLALVNVVGELEELQKDRIWEG